MEWINNKPKKINVNETSVCNSWKEMYIAFNSGFFDEQIKKWLKILHKKGYLNEIFGVSDLNKLFYKKNKSKDDFRKITLIRKYFNDIFFPTNQKIIDKKYKINIEQKVFDEFFDIIESREIEKYIEGINETIKEKVKDNISNVNYIFTNINKEWVLFYLQTLFNEKKYKEINKIIKQVDKFTNNYWNKVECFMGICANNNEYFKKIKKVIIKSIWNFDNFKEISNKNLKILGFFNNEDFKYNFLPYILFKNVDEVLDFFNIYNKENKSWMLSMAYFIDSIKLETIKFLDYLTNLWENYDRDIVYHILRFFVEKEMFDFEEFEKDFPNFVFWGDFDIPYNYDSEANKFKEIDFNKYIKK